MILLYNFSSWTWCKSPYSPQWWTSLLTWHDLREKLHFFFFWFNYFSTVLSFPPGWVFLVGPQWYLATAALPRQALRWARNVSALPHQWKPHWEKQKRSDGAQNTSASFNQSSSFWKTVIMACRTTPPPSAWAICVFPDTAKGLPAETRRNIQRCKKFDTTLTKLIITLQSCNNRAADGWPLMSDGNLAPECKRWKQSVDFFSLSRFLFLNLGSLKPLNVRFWNVTHIRVESFQLIADVLIRERRLSFLFFLSFFNAHIHRERTKRCNLCSSGLRWMRVTLSWTRRETEPLPLFYMFLSASALKCLRARETHKH